MVSRRSEPCAKNKGSICRNASAALVYHIEAGLRPRLNVHQVAVKSMEGEALERRCFEILFVLVLQNRDGGFLAQQVGIVGVRAPMNAGDVPGHDQPVAAHEGEADQAGQHHRESQDEYEPPSDAIGQSTGEEHKEDADETGDPIGEPDI